MADSQFSRTLIFMLIGAAIILALSLGIRHAFGLYLVPMSEEFGWGHNVFSLAIAMQNLIWGAVQPITGAFADKYGSKIVVAVGGALYALGLLLMAVSSTGLLLNLSVGLILGLALSATSFPVLLSAVGRAAPPEKRSLAMGIASAAGSFGQFIMLPSTLLLFTECRLVSSTCCQRNFNRFDCTFGLDAKSPDVCRSECDSYTE